MNINSVLCVVSGLHWKIDTAICAIIVRRKMDGHTFTAKFVKDVLNLLGSIARNVQGVRKRNIDALS